MDACSVVVSELWIAYLVVRSERAALDVELGVVPLGAVPKRFALSLAKHQF
jgi:hypothetical protein